MFEKKDQSPNIWMSFADLLTSSLIVFILITVVLVIRTRDEYVKVKENQEKTTEKLGSSLKGIDGIQVTTDGVIRFYSKGGGQSNIFFEDAKFKPLSSLKKKLNLSWPLFQKEIKDAIDDKEIGIKEIRIEGHTDSRKFYGDVHGNLGLSQRRAAETWFYIRDSLMKDEDPDFRSYIESKVVTVGFGDQKLLNKNGHLVAQDGGMEDQDISRRIEMSVLYESQDGNTDNPLAK